MNFDEIMNYDIDKILTISKEECVELCRDVMKTFITRKGCEDLFSFVEKAIFIQHRHLPGTIPTTKPVFCATLSLLCFAWQRKETIQCGRSF